MTKRVDTNISENNKRFAPPYREETYTILSLGETVTAVTAVGAPIFQQMQPISSSSILPNQDKKDS
jgi:hypothetical protein